MILNFFAGSAAQLTGAMSNHLWQSTLFAAFVALVTLGFRKSQARIRFALWLAASIKFLIPFSLLVALGSSLATPHPATEAPPGLSATITTLTQPFSQAGATTAAKPSRVAALVALLPSALALVWVSGCIAVLFSWAVRWRRITAQIHRSSPLLEGREVDALRRIEQEHAVRKPAPFLLSPDSMEPGVFGILRPALLWPQGISAHLDDRHLEAILMHEVTHIRRRDNLTAAAHMLVEAIFWFHPLVWWLGTRLMDERERACDETVLTLGNQPGVYAESILKACRFCVESPLPCVAGVSGSNLKRRITRIMNQQLGTRLTVAGRLLLASLATAAVAVPIAIGILHPSQLPAQEPQAASIPISPDPVFDSVNIKISTGAEGESKIEMRPGYLNQTNTTLKTLIAMAYGVQEYQITGEPSWVDTDRFDIEAKWKDGPGADTAMFGAPPPPPPPPPPAGKAAVMITTEAPIGASGTPLSHGHFNAMICNLLGKTFNLKIDDVAQNLPVYELVVADSGSKLTPTPTDPAPPVAPKGKPMVTVRIGPNNNETEFILTNASADVLANLLAQQLHRQVIDKTDLKGQYNIDVHWPKDQEGFDPVAAALEDQVGLKLKASQAQVAVLQVIQVEKPSGN